MAALLQVGDELPCAVCAVGCTGPGLPVVVQGSACIVESVADPGVLGEEDGDVVASLPGYIDVPPGFLVLDGLLVVAKRLAGVTRQAVKVAEIISVMAA